MFIGEYEHTLDDKGRVIMPAKFREDLGMVFYMTRGMDDCIFVYSKDEWAKIEEKVNQLRLSRRDARAFARMFFSGATQSTLDKQGRVVIPARLREFADLEKEIIFIGVSSRIEIWDKEAWDKYSENEKLNYDALTEKMEEFDF